MKKLAMIIVSTMKTVLMPLFFTLLFLYLKSFGDILTGVYILFPLCYIFQALFSPNKAYYLIPSYILTTTIFLILTNQWYRVGDSVGCAITYLLLGSAVYGTKKLIMKKKIS